VDDRQSVDTLFKEFGAHRFDAIDVADDACRQLGAMS
jgi:hypothetical protein